MSLTPAERNAENRARAKFSQAQITQAARAAGLLSGGKIYRRDEWDILVAAIESGAYRVIIVPVKAGEEVER
jgi:hypothetical protein